MRLIDGGRAKWLAETRPTTTDVPAHPHTTYRAKAPREELRALRDQVKAVIAKPGSALVDVRSLKEYAGELLAPDRRHLRRRIGQLSAAQLAAVLTGIDTVLGR